MEKLIGQVVDTFLYALPALIGGAVDYINQIQRGSKKWSVIGFMVHLMLAMFFGWVTGMVAGGFGYSDGIVAASGGMGGFLGVRVADLITYKLLNIDRK